MAVYRRHEIARREQRRAAYATAATMPALDRRKFEEIISDPRLRSAAFYNRDVFDHQLQIHESVEKYRKTAVRSGNGPGKSYTAAEIVVAFLVRNPGSIVVTTAPTWLQVKTILWREIGDLVGLASHTELTLPQGTVISGFGPTPFTTEWNLSGDTGVKWYAIGVSTRKKENFMGRHSGRVLVVIDEGSGVPDEIFHAVNYITTGEHDRVLVIGNPTRAEGYFFDIFNPASKVGDGWSKIHIDCSQLPWIVAGLPPPAPGLVSQAFIDEIVAEFGRDSPAFDIHVRGNFSTDAVNTWINHIHCWAATEAEECQQGAPVIDAWDVATFGDCEIVKCRMEGDVQTECKAYRNMDEMELAGLIIDEFRENRSDCIVIDADGMGHGVYARVSEQGYPVIPFRGGSEANNSDRFLNNRTESYYNLCREIKRQKVRILPDKKMLRQLAYLPYKRNSRGMMQLLSKDDLRKMGRKSPDRADALMMARWGQWRVPDYGNVDEDVVIIPRRGGP